MILTVDTDSAVPAYEQIRQQVTALVDGGALPAGTRLPPIRQLAHDLQLAPGTVAKAYAQLERTGVTSQTRRGTVVAARTTLSQAERAAELHTAARAFAATVRALDVDAATARRAVDDALGAEASSETARARRHRSARLPASPMPSPMPTPSP